MQTHKAVPAFTIQHCIANKCQLLVGLENSQDQRFKTKTKTAVSRITRLELCREMVDVVSMLSVVVSVVEALQTSSKSMPTCPVRPAVDPQAGAEADCLCSVLDEIQCRGLSAVPAIDASATYRGRRTFRSLHLASRHAFRADPTKTVFVDRSQSREQADRKSKILVPASVSGQHQEVDGTPRGRVSQNDTGQKKWRKYVHGVANPRIEDGYKTE